MASNKLLILTGPGGSGKSTVAELLRNKYGFSLIDGDQLDTEFFPKGGQRLPENIENLKRAHLKILREAIKEFKKGKNVNVLNSFLRNKKNDFIVFKPLEFKVQSLIFQFTYFECLKKNFSGPKINFENAIF